MYLFFLIKKFLEVKRLYLYLVITKAMIEDMEFQRDIERTVSKKLIN